VGALYNEVPDRVEDTAILAAFGVAAGWPMLGLWAALAAMACAYVRVLGGALGQRQSFIGPMAKQHRMAAVSLGCVLGFGEALAGTALGLAGIVLWVVLIGSLATVARRLALIAAGLGR
jgi:phosphatidylglycerophosphate synthase